MADKKQLFNSNGKFYAYILADSYTRKEELKEDGFFWKKELKAWVSHENLDKYSEACVEVDKSKIDWSDIEDVYNKLKIVIDAARPKIEKEPSKSEYMYNEGDKICETMTLVSIRELDTRFGTSYLHTFKSGDNILVWFTQSGRKGAAGVTYTVKATVKEHSEYRDEKRTVLTRCKLMNAEV